MLRSGAVSAHNSGLSNAEPVQQGEEDEILEAAARCRPAVAAWPRRPSPRRRSSKSSRPARCASAPRAPTRPSPSTTPAARWSASTSRSAEAIAEQLGVEAEFVEGKWDGLIAGLDANRYDVVINQVGITDERKAKYDFSEPYIASKAALIVRGDNTDITSFADLKGKKSAQSLTSNFGKLAEELRRRARRHRRLRPVDRAGAPGPRRRHHQRQPVLPRLQEAAARRRREDRRDRRPTPTSPASSLAKGKPELLAAINKALADIKADGTYAEISQKYFGEDVSQ